jgi:UDP-3-O-[3-hydroxymyristoyl] N-acetylglucosamine deacetylase/3-hydroxyacyl-[acyl-carrier-protein] dehydratase
MTLQPAPPNTGVRFRRVDLDGAPEIEARAENVVDTQRSTTLGKGAVKVHTVEHVLAALAGAGIDNAVIELDASEPPIADGSSREFARLVREAGRVPQAEPVEVHRIDAPIELQSGESHMAVFPHPGLKITCTSSDKGGRFTQFFSLEVTPASWEKELSHARTFCFYEEIEFLIKNGLIKGGSLENAIVIREDAVLTNEPLRYPEEFVRHKMLDIVGDLALIGRPIQGHVIATRPSHRANTDLAKAIVARMRRPLEAAQTFAPPPTPGPGTKALIDGPRIVAQKNVTMGEPFFEGHFPGHPIMPGVLQLEAMAQVAGILMMRQAENAGKLAYFMSAEDVKWRKPVRPGDILMIEVEMTKSRGKIGKAKGRCTVDGEVVSEAEVTFMLMDR